MDLLHILRRPRAAGTRSGFTLVELLVVIGIISVLIGILLPALGSARKHAATVKCLSNLRQIGVAFNLYANFYRDAFPVVRQDTPDNGRGGPLYVPPDGGAGDGPQNVVNRYYTDMLMPFLSKTGKMNFEASTNDILAFQEARKSVLWGCPEWEGWRGTGGSTIDGIFRFDSGYAMNFYPTYTATYPPANQITTTVRGQETQMRTTVFVLNGQYTIGKYFKRSQWTKPADRMLMCDANLWYLGFFPGSTIGAQPAQRLAASGAGTNNIDRYRHGKYPPVVSGFYSTRGGKTAFNVLFVDGHATTLFDIRDGYKAIRMRFP